MLNTEIDVLVIGHNICVAFGFLPIGKQVKYIRLLRDIERRVIDDAGVERDKEK